ncbi:MAG: L,D-transpeptidase family protein [Acidobacteriota bacterium]|nr:L,D-transpeptidase family protein [Acidobacteriota bacterium]
MKSFWFSISLLLAFLAGGSFCLAQKSPLDLSGAKQMILVTTPDWNTINGKLELYERKNTKGKWRKIGDDVSIVVGRTGLAWGDGLHDNSKNSSADPVKREGDGKSPAGVFKLTSIFGVAEKTDFIRMPYTRLVESTECVDDVKSGKYNTIVDRFKVGFLDWNSSEKMLEVGEQYAWGVVVAHNSNPVKRGGGSCIFLHIWKDANTGTAGCTAMPRENLDTILRWLDEKKKPIFVQLPAGEREKLQQTWKLPANK